MIPASADSSSSPDDLRRRVRHIVALLDRHYGRLVWQPRHGPVEELIYTILSQNTADVNTERTYAALRQRFSSWVEVRDASTVEVERAISLGGLAATKAPRIKAVLAALSERTGEPDLSELAAMNDEEALAYLQRLPGVGPKTAACVLLFSLGRPVMPVDTHVYRVAGRLGLLGPKTEVAEAHKVLTALCDPDDVYPLHINLVRHGRALCRARRPSCAQCPLRNECPSAASLTVGSGG